MDSDLLVLLLLGAATMLAVLFTVVPLVPGTLFIPAGAALVALVEVGWDEFPWWFWVLQVAMGVAYLFVDNAAQFVGVRRVGGSRAAMVGGAIGVFVGPIVLALVLGPFAILLGPPVGAVVGTVLGEEYAHRRATTDAAPMQRPGVRQLGVGALVAYAVSTALKLGIVVVQAVPLFLLARN